MLPGRVTPPDPTCGTLGRQGVAARVLEWCGTLGGRKPERASAETVKGGRGAPPQNKNTAESPDQRRHFNAPRGGFALNNLFVGIVILGILAGLTAPQIVARRAAARNAAAHAQLELLGAALNKYRRDNGAYPTTEQGLGALREKPTRDPSPTAWRGPYLPGKVPSDPWGRPYLSLSPGVRNPIGYDLQSLGRDGSLGGKGENRDLIGQ
jgi:general secretion pathway protein G